MKNILSLICFCLIVVTFPLYSETNWPMFGKDESHKRISDETISLPISLKWKYKTDGPIRSSPAVYEGIVYIGSDDFYLYALEANTGKFLWKFKAEGKIASSPAVYSGTVFFGSRDNNLYAVDSKTGNLKWKYKTNHILNCSPTVSKDIVFVGSDDETFYALESASGKLIWKFKTGGDILSSPSVEDEVVYFGSNDKNIYALDMSSGKEKWSYLTDGWVVASPAILGDALYVTSTDGHFYAINLKDGKLLYRIKVGASLFIPSPVSSSAVNGELAILGSGKNVYAVNLRTRNISWCYKTKNFVASSPVIVGSIVLVGDGLKVPLPLIGSNDGIFYAIDLNTGKVVWKYETDGAVMSSPAIANGMVYVGSADGYIYTFQ